MLSKLGKLVPFLEAGHAPFARELVTALAAEASDALQRLEREAAVHHPYVFARQSDFLVSAWADAQSGSPTPAEGLKRWGGFVDEQRDSLRRYAAQADPLVRFLTTARAAPALTRRWAGIVEDVANYDQKLAGNGLGALDGFLRDVVPVLVPERDCGAGGAAATARSAGFLGTVRNELFDDTLKRCRDLARSSLQSRYAAVARSFNQLLAGRFPFSQNVDGTREAAAADLGEFLRLYDRQDGRSLLQQIQGRSCGDDAALFLSRLDALYPVLSPARELQTLALDLLPEFRVNRDREVGGNQIAQWQLDVGRQTFRDGEVAKAGRWVSGDPVRFALRFAKDSPSRPIGARRPGPSRRRPRRAVRLSGRVGAVRASSPPAVRCAGRSRRGARRRAEYPGLRHSGRAGRGATAARYDGRAVAAVSRLHSGAGVSARQNRSAHHRRVSHAGARRLVVPGQMNSERGPMDPQSVAFSVETDRLLSPIAVDEPTGTSLRYEGTYDRISALRREDDPALDQGVWQTELKTADWPQVAQACWLAIETQSKDIQIAAWLLEAWIHLHGVAGVREGLHLIAELCDTYWDGLHPDLQDGDLDYRLAPLVWIDEKLSIAVKLIPVTSPQSEDLPPTRSPTGSWRAGRPGARWATGAKKRRSKESSRARR